MKLRFPITVPQQVKASRIRRTRVTAIECAYCHQWVKPRYLALPACVCRRCEKAGANQTWKPTAAHLARAHADVARGRAARPVPVRDRRNITLAGR